MKTKLPFQRLPHSTDGVYDDDGHLVASVYSCVQRDAIVDLFVAAPRIEKIVHKMAAAKNEGREGDFDLLFEDLLEAIPHKGPVWDF